MNEREEMKRTRYAAPTLEKATGETPLFSIVLISAAVGSSVLAYGRGTS